MLKLLGVALLGALVCAAPASADNIAKAGAAAATDISSQRREPGTRLRVYPGRRLLYRDCTFRLAQQWRPSGPVIVPVQHCWWVRG